MKRVFELSLLGIPAMLRNQDITPKSTHTYQSFMVRKNKELRLEYPTFDYETRLRMIESEWRRKNPSGVTNTYTPARSSYFSNWSPRTHSHLPGNQIPDWSPSTHYNPSTYHLPTENGLDSGEDNTEYLESFFGGQNEGAIA